MSKATNRKNRAGRRGPLATVALLAIGLFFTGGAYALISNGTAEAQSDINSQEMIDEGEKLFAANCATCHGVNLEGSDIAPTLIGVGAASVDFQVGTGRMPLAASGPQGQEKPEQFTDQQVKAMAAYVASLSVGPPIPDPRYLDEQGDAANGAELFRINCAMCHNVAGSGGALTEGKWAPAINSTPAHTYEAMITGPQNMPVFNDANLSPEDKRDIITALAYIKDTPSVGGYALGALGPVAEGLFAWVFGMGAIVAVTVWLTAKSN
ncbi:cytochrome bc1 complex diheme cytochrome c subunit [Planctomonas psychrotolerans]|uniref:cytochrome bc1 complex diheme cytochrome c subunit n=1 Tax=Planctomonas psychrotolerans TaxID=2528712 RepID=UPI00123978AA|nr:c-type cytochrome [Planctomonas psychrotolerans]